LSFSDVDLTDTHSINVSEPAIVWSEGTSGLPDLSGVFDGKLTAVADQDANTFAWTFDTTGDFDFLGEGEALTVTYLVDVQDDSDVDATDNSTQVPVVITITGTNDAPVSKSFEVGVSELGSADIEFDPHVSDAEDDVNPNDETRVTIESTPKFGKLIGSDGNELHEDDVVSLSEVTYVADPNLDLSGEVADGFRLGADDDGKGQKLVNWGDDDDNTGIREYDLGGIVVTTSVTSDGAAAPLTQYNNNDGDSGHIGNGIADDSGEGLNAGDVLTVDFGGIGVTQANIGLDGMGGHFYDHGSKVKLTVTYTDGSTEDFTYTKENADDDEFAEVSFGSGQTFDFDIGNNAVSSIAFTTLDSTNSDGVKTGSNWELRYVEVPPNSIVLSDSFDYSPVDSDDLGGNTSTVTITGLEDAVNHPPTITEGGPKLMGGLMSEFYLSGSQISNLDDFKQVVSDNEPAALFISTGLSYNLGNGDVGRGSNLEFFLGGDSESLTKDSDSRADSQDAGIRVFGDVELEQGTYVLKVRADDGFEITLNGDEIAVHTENQGPTTRYFKFEVLEDGMHSLQALWWDQLGQYVFDVDIAKVDSPLGLVDGTTSAPSGVEFADFEHTSDNPWCHTLLETNSGLTTMGSIDVGDLNTAQLVELKLDLTDDDPTVVSTGPTLASMGLDPADFKSMLTLVGGDSQVVLDHTESADTVYYVFDSGNEAFDGLDYGETITVTYPLSATDGAATTTGTIEVVINGTNDAPTLSADARLGSPGDVPQNVTATNTGVYLFENSALETVEADQTISQFTMVVSGVVDGNEEQLVMGEEIQLIDGFSQPITWGGMDVLATVSLSGTSATVVFTDNGGDLMSVDDVNDIINNICYVHKHFDSDSDMVSDATSGLRTIEITSMADTGNHSDSDAESPLAMFSGLTSEVWVGSQITDSGLDNIFHGPGGVGADHGGTAESEMIVFSDMTDAAIQGNANGNAYADNTLLLSGNGGSDLFVAIDRDFGTEDGQIVNATIDDFQAILDGDGQPEGDVLDLSALAVNSSNSTVTTNSDGDVVITAKDDSGTPVGEFTLAGNSTLGAGFDSNTTFEQLVDESIIKIV